MTDEQKRDNLMQEMVESPTNLKFTELLIADKKVELARFIDDLAISPNQTIELRMLVRQLISLQDKFRVDSQVLKA